VPTSDPRSLFGKKLRELRLQRQLSQEKLGELADMDRNYIGATERGKYNICLVSMTKIARALKVKPKELLDLIP
jgi:transcriptional regulator with XRE-family HTH domain